VPDVLVYQSCISSTARIFSTLFYVNVSATFSRLHIQSSTIEGKGENQSARKRKILTRYSCVKFNFRAESCLTLKCNVLTPFVPGPFSFVSPCICNPALLKPFWVWKMLLSLIVTSMALVVALSKREAVTLGNCSVWLNFSLPRI